MMMNFSVWREDFADHLAAGAQEYAHRDDTSPSTLFFHALYGPCSDQVFAMALRHVQGLSVSDVGSGRRRRG